MRQGDSRSINLIIKNPNSEPLTLSIENTLPELISQSKSLITLKPNEEQK